MISLKKISLAKPGDFSEIPLNDLVCTLKWTASVDLDFYAYYKKNVETNSGGFFSKMFSGGKSSEEVERVYFGKKGSLNRYPYISLDQDSGIGDVGGDNTETLRFASLEEHEEILIVANIFSKRNAVFSNYDGKVLLVADGKEYEVPLTSSNKGNYCVVSKIQKVDGQFRLVNVNQTFTSENKVKELLK